VPRRARYFSPLPPASGSGSHDTATITVTFTQLSDGTASTLSSYSDTAIWAADYNNQTDSITWSNSGSDLNPIVVNFTDGSVFDITSGNASDWSIKPTINFTFTEAPAVAPEPSSLAPAQSSLRWGCSEQRACSAAAPGNGRFKASPAVPTGRQRSGLGASGRSRYETLPTGLRAMTALIVFQNKAIKPLLAAARPLRPARGPHNPKPIDAHYQTIQGAMRGVFHELGLAA
jgi:hypothetical protein